MTPYTLIHQAGQLFLSTDAGSWIIGTGSPSSFSDTANLELDGVSLTLAPTFRGLNAATLSAFIGLPVTGLLGIDVLKRFDITFDLPSSQIIFSSEPVALNGTVVPLQDFQGLPMIEAVIGGHSSRAFLETGAKLSYWADASLVKYPATGVFEDFYPGIGLFQVDTYRVPLGIGGRNFEIRFGVPTIQVLSMLRMAGVTAILGNEIFQKHKIGFQPRQNRIQFL
jgi:hypothetical protein